MCVPHPSCHPAIHHTQNANVDQAGMDVCLDDGTFYSVLVICFIGSIGAQSQHSVKHIAAAQKNFHFFNRLLYGSALTGTIPPQISALVNLEKV